MSMVAQPDIGKERLIAAYAIDAVRDGISAERFWGLELDNPMVAALFSILEHVEWSASMRALIQALPHAPDVFSLHDLRSTLSRIGIASSVSRVNRLSAETIRTPALFVDGSDVKGLWVQNADGTCRMIDPVTGALSDYTFERGHTVISFNKSAHKNGNWFVFDLMHRSRGVMLSLLGVKLVINLVTVLASLSVFAIFDKVVSTGSIDTLVAIGLGMTGAFAMDFVYRFAKSKMLARLSARLEYLISSLTFRQIIALPLEKLIMGTVAQQLARLRPLQSMASSIAVPLLDALSDLPFAFLLTILLFFLAGPIGALPIVIFVVFLGAFALFTPGIRRLEDEARQAAETHAQIMSDFVNHADDIRLTYDHEIWARRAKHSAMRRASTQRKAEEASRNLAMIGVMATPLVGGGTAIAGAALAMNGSLASGGLIAAMILSWRIIAPMQTFLLLVSKWSDVFRLSNQLNRLMTMPVEEDQAETGIKPALNGEIELSGVAHRYGPLADWALRNVSVKVPAGTFVAVTGPSGSGKTTFLRMIPGLIQPLAGSVNIDGLNLRQIPVGHLRETISYVPFNSILIHGTIGQNMRLGSPLVSDEEILQVLGEVGLGEVVHALPEGIDTRLTIDVQSGLPKGFRQAMAIAQALMSRPKVLLLDEPARSLDSRLDQAMMSALEARRGKMTILMVTHRPSHIRAADCQIELQNGILRNVVFPRRKAS